MVLAANQNVSEKNYWQRDPGVRASVFSLSSIFADYVIGERRYGEEPLPDNYDPTATGNSDRDQLVYQRNNLMQTYWLTRRRAAATLQGETMDGGTFEAIVRALCNGLAILAADFTGTQVTGNTTEEECLSAMFTASDTLVIAFVQGNIAAPSEILEPTDLEPAYDVYWTRSGDPGYDRSDSTTWGRFRAPGRYRNYYDVSNWTDAVDNNRLLKENTRQTTEPGI